MRRDDPAFPSSYPLGFWGRTAAVSAVACLLGMLVLRWLLGRDLGVEFAPAFQTLKSLLGFLVPALAFGVLAVLFVASLAVFLTAMFASHRVAGPLFRLQRIAGHLADGTLVGRIHLRAGDQGKTVAEEINGWVDVRRARLAALETLADACAVEAAACRRAAAAGNPDAFRAARERLREAARAAGRS